MGHIVGSTGQVNVEPAVLVDINKCNTAVPLSIVKSHEISSNILKLKIPFVQIYPGRYLVAGKDDILESVIIEVSDPNACAVINIFKVHNVQRILIVDHVGKGDAGLVRVQQLKTGFGGTRYKNRHRDHQEKILTLSHQSQFRI